jgi:hypothetical protein
VDRGGELFNISMLNGAQHVHTDSGIGRDLLQAYSSCLSFCSQKFTEAFHEIASS